MIAIGKYRHFKGGEYRVIGIARHSETGEDLVIYQSISDQKIWARPLTMFFEEVEKEGQKIPRFTKID